MLISQNEVVTADYQIGDVVALRSHPYFNEKDHSFIILGGDPQLLSPLMVIVEILRENKLVYDENTGTELVGRNSFQCHCIWYSQKGHQFEEAWFSSKLLKGIVLEPKSENESNVSLKVGASVCFKTASIELGKQKSSFKQYGSDDPRKTITSHLPFVSPVMQVIGTTKNEPKEPLIDFKTGRIKRWGSRLLVKCKYYNPVSDKFSETLIPIEALNSVMSIGKEELIFLKEQIDKDLYLKRFTGDKSIPVTIVKPLRIIFINGMYSLEFFDYILGKSDEVNLPSNEFTFSPEYILKDLVKKSLPDFKSPRNGISISKLTIKKHLGNTKYVRIKYKSLNDKLTERVIMNFSLSDVKEEDEHGVVQTYEYLTGHCLLRKADRTFRIDRIQKIEAFDL